MRGRDSKEGAAGAAPFLLWQPLALDDGKQVYLLDDLLQDLILTTCDHLDDGGGV